MLAVLVFLSSVILPGRASAHAAFVSAEPEPGAALPSAPGVVVLRFSEPLIPKLSRATVIAPDSQRFEGGVTEQQEIRVPLTTNATGVYEVLWTTVSPLDGHTLRGTFQFGVGVTPGEHAEGEAAFAPSGAELALALARTIEYLGLLAALGMVLIQGLADRQPSLKWVRCRLPAPLALAFAGGLAVVLGEAFTAAPAPSVEALTSYLTSGLPGAARVFRLGMEALALILWFVSTRLVALPLLGAFTGLAAAGHAAAVQPAWWGITVDAVHLISAGLWAGGILALATVRPPGGWRGSAGRCLLDRFSPIALPAFAITVGFGLVRGLQELSALSDLLTSAYGRVLLVKGLAVLAIVSLSLLAWRRRFAQFRLEAGLAILVLVATGVLAAFPLPPGRQVEAETERERAAPSAALPGAGDLTLGGSAGEVLVGLTLRPGEPGRNQILVYLLPLDGEAAAAGIPVQLRLAGRALELAECGPACRRTEATVEGGERVEVHVNDPRGGTAVFALPRLPAPDGTSLFRRMQERMHALSTYRLDEVLGPVEPPNRVAYAFQAPDRMHSTFSTRLETIWIGEIRYTRDGPAAPWRREDIGLSLDVPRFAWDIGGGRLVAPRMVGRTTLDGVEMQVLSFFIQAGGAPIWFRLWVDSEGLVHQAEMRAPGHFMDHRYSDFDAPFTIEPPTSGGSYG